MKTAETDNSDQTCLLRNAQILPITMEDQEWLETAYRNTIKWTNISKILVPLAILTIPVWNFYYNWSLNDGKLPDNDPIWILVIGALGSYLCYFIMNFVSSSESKVVAQADRKEIYTGGVLVHRRLGKTNIIKPASCGEVYVVFPPDSQTVIVNSEVIVDKDLRFGDNVILEMAVVKDEQRMLPLRIRAVN